MLALLSTCLSPKTLAQQGIDVVMKDGLLSIDARNVPITELADLIGRESGISVVVQGDTRAAISVEIDEEPFEKAIAKISPNHLLVHASKALNADLIEVVLIVAEGGAPAATTGGDFLPTGAPAEEIAGAQAPAAANPVPDQATDSANSSAASSADGNGTVGQLRDKMRRLNSRIVGANNPTDVTNSAEGTPTDTQ